MKACGDIPGKMSSRCGSRRDIAPCDVGPKDIRKEREQETNNTP